MQILLEGQRDEKSTRALSDALRNRKEVGEMMSLIGTKNQRQFGGTLRADVAGQQAQKEKQDQRAMTQGYYDETSTYRNSALAETMRHNKEMEKAALLKAESDASLKRFKPPSVSAQKRTTEAIESYDGIQRVINSFQDDYASGWGMVGEGSLTNTIGKIAGTPGMKDQARWWADYDLIYTLGRRNKLFGSALTDSEIKAWEGANISPNSPPDVIRKGLRTLMEIATKKFQQQYTNDAQLYTPEWVDSTYAPYLGMEPADPMAGPAPQAPAESPPQV
jgi:hypothetical protein